MWPRGTGCPSGLGPNSTHCVEALCVPCPFVPPWAPVPASSAQDPTARSAEDSRRAGEDSGVQHCSVVFLPAHLTCGLHVSLGVRTWGQPADRGARSPHPHFQYPCVSKAMAAGSGGPGQGQALLVRGLRCPAHLHICQEMSSRTKQLDRRCRWRSEPLGASRRGAGLSSPSIPPSLSHPPQTWTPHMGRVCCAHPERTRPLGGALSPESSWRGTVLMPPGPSWATCPGSSSCWRG